MRFPLRWRWPHAHKNTSGKYPQIQSMIPLYTGTWPMVTGSYGWTPPAGVSPSGTVAPVLPPNFIWPVGSITPTGTVPLVFPPGPRISPIYSTSSGSIVPRRLMPPFGNPG